MEEFPTSNIHHLQPGRQLGGSGGTSGAATSPGLPLQQTASDLLAVPTDTYGDDDDYASASMTDVAEIGNFLQNAPGKWDSHTHTRTHGLIPYPYTNTHDRLTTLVHDTQPIDQHMWSTTCMRIILILLILPVKISTLVPINIPNRTRVQHLVPVPIHSKFAVVKHDHVGVNCAPYTYYCGQSLTLLW